MKQYDSYKDSGVEWIGKIPSHWDLLKGKYSTKVVSGFPFNSDLFTYDEDDSYLPLIRIRDITNLTTEVRYKGKYPEESVVNNGDVLIGMDGDFNISLWKGEKGLLNQRVCRLVETDRLDKKYAYYMLGFPLKCINDVTYSTTVKHLSTYDILDSILPVPPINEQKEIANYLDKKCGEIDKAIATQEKRVELLKELRQNIITKAVTRGINPNAPLKDSGVEWIGEVPEHWNRMQLKNALVSMQDGTHGSFQRVESPYLLLSAKNVFEDGIHITSNESTISEADYQSIISNGYPQKGDVVVCCVGTIGRCCLYEESMPLAFQRSVTFLRAKKTVSNKYILYIIRSNITQVQLITLAKTSAQSGIYMGDLSSIKIVLPPLSEQQEIVSYIESQTARLDASIEKAEHQIELLQELKQSIITEVVTGKRKVV